LEASKKALPIPQWGEQAQKLHCTSIAHSILQYLSECGDVNQQKVMLVWVLDHNLMFTMKPDHWLNLKDVATITKIVENVKVRL
jgi:hypothetical protein